MTDRVGIVVVSHSRDLADAAVALAVEMVAEDPGPIAVAAGTDDGTEGWGFGTDATAVMAAIEEVASPAGVLVVMDLGSAVLSAEMALEFLGEVDHPVRLTAAPLVEGLVAAVVQAALGGDLDTVAHEATTALAAKRDQLADVIDDQQPPTADAADDAGGRAPTPDGPDASVEVELVDPDGLHARPAARLVAAAARADAEVRVVNATTGSDPLDATTLGQVVQLRARQGHVLRIEATGPDARQVAEELAELVRGGLDEADDGSSGEDTPAT